MIHPQKKQVYTSDAGLQPFQDFIVDVLPESQAFELARDFTGFVSQHEDKEVNLLVLNCFTGDCRAVKITPTRKWTNADSLLGLKLRLENIENAVNSVCRVTKSMLYVISLPRVTWC
jgi:GRASP55/65 PDZ-like domain